ncbi:hypothetical protein FRC08_010977 [Ceratobasidium sp. 394]|nr:hypothetical protein FRC08_010977 [Ceratobasidium sp. 394]
MSATKQISPHIADITQKTEQLGIDSDHRRQNSDDDSDDEFHDARDRAPEPGADDIEELTEAEILVGKSTNFVV